MRKFLIVVFCVLFCYSAQAQVIESANSVFNNDIFVFLRPNGKNQNLEKYNIYPSFNHKKYQTSLSNRFFAERKPSIYMLDVEEPVKRLVVEVGDFIIVNLTEKAGEVWYHDISGKSISFYGKQKQKNKLYLFLSANQTGISYFYLDKIKDDIVTYNGKTTIVVRK